MSTGTQTSAATAARPPARWYLYAVVILLAGVALAAFGLRSAHAAESDRIDALQRIPVGETSDIELDAGAVYSVYYEQTTDAWPNPWPSVTGVPQLR